MGFVRHELGKRLRIKRIPALHIQLDDSAERGTRVLHLLQELEAGVDPAGGHAVQRVAADAGQAAAPRGRRRAGGGRGRRGRPGHAAADPARALVGRPPPVEPPRTGRQPIRPGRPPDGAEAQAGDAAGDERVRGSRRPSPASGVPEPLLARLRGARATCWPSATSIPTPTRWAPCWASACSSRRWAAGRRPSAPIPSRRCTRSCPGIGPVPHRPGSRRGLRPARPRRLRDRRQRGGRRRAHTPPCSRPCRGSIIDHHASNDGAGEADWIDPGAAATCEMVALLAVRLGLPLDLGDRALADALMAGIVMDTATFAHPNATPRTLAVSAALVAAGAPLSDISRRLYRTKPDTQLRLFGRVLDRLDTTPDRRVIWSTLRVADLVETGAIPAHSEGIIDLLAQSETAEVSMLLKEQEDGTTRLSRAHEARGRGRDRAHGHVGRWWACPGRRRHDPAAARRGACRSWARWPSAWPRRSAGEPPRPPRRPRRGAGRRQALRTHLARRRGAGPPSLVHEARGPRRHARPVRGGRAAGVPGARDAPGRVPPHGREALPRDGLLRRDAPRPTTSTASGRRWTARPWRREQVEAALAAFTGPIRQVPPIYSRGPDRGPARVPDGPPRRDRGAGRRGTW